MSDHPLRAALTTVLEETSASSISAALVETRRRAGSPAMGMVMTLVIAVPEKDAEEALETVRDAAREHPSRVLAVVMGTARGRSRIDAEIRSGPVAGIPGELALIRLTGEVARHPASVVLPLLLPDSPVVVWWPSDAPRDPAADPLGRLASRRITDAAQVSTARSTAMLHQCATYAAGNTDLAWTRITPWRAVLAAALDQVGAKVTHARVCGERVSPSADLLGAWLGDRLKVPVQRERSSGPGITGVTLVTRAGEIRVERHDGVNATLSVPGQPDRPVALRRREVSELLTEELRRMDPDDVYAATVARMHRQAGRSGKTTAGAPAKPRARKATAAQATKRTKGGGR